MRKPIVVAIGAVAGQVAGCVVELVRLDRHSSFASFAGWLQDADAGGWIGGFDLPFGLPRELVEHLGWPTQWLPLMRHYASLDRANLRELFVAFCAARPVGSKFAHRACDRPAGSSPSMKWVNPPVAWMMHAGVPLLIAAGVHMPGLHEGDASRVALEAYPGLLARELIGSRSYKSDDLAKQTAARFGARQALVEALEGNKSRLGVRLRLSAAQRESLITDASGDAIDAVLCLVQAAWASTQPNWGLPEKFDPIEGWIVSA